MDNQETLFTAAALLDFLRQYDIFPDDPNIWADVQGDTLVALLDEILE